MDLSIVIRVKDDIRIKRCVESIDESVETVVVLNTPTQEVRTIVNDLTVKIVEIDNNNLAKAYNVGIEASTFDNILLMDSDCIFDRDTIGKLYWGLKEAPLSKGKVIFTHSDLVSRIVALSREYHVSDIANAYAPPLAFNKSIREEIGGYFFDEDLPWTEDHEFDQRVQKARLPIKFIPGATIKHDEQTFMDDLGSSFNYGIGYFEGIKKGVTQPSFIYGGRKTLLGSIGYDILRATALPLLFFDVTRKKGVLPAVFMSVWMAAFSAGYYAQSLFKILGEKEK